MGKNVVFPQHCGQGAVIRLNRSPTAFQKIQTPRHNIVPCWHTRRRSDVMIVKDTASFSQEGNIRRPYPIAAIRRQKMTVQTVQQQNDCFHDLPPLDQFCHFISKFYEIPVRGISWPREQIVNNCFYRSRLCWSGSSVSDSEKRLLRSYLNFLLSIRVFDCKFFGIFFRLLGVHVSLSCLENFFSCLLHLRVSCIEK